MDMKDKLKLKNVYGEIKSNYSKKMKYRTND